MKKEFKLRILLYSMLIMIAMVAVSFSMTACGDDDEEEGDGPIAWLKFDGKKYDVKNLLFLHETGTTNRYNFEVITDKVPWRFIYTRIIGVTQTCSTSLTMATTAVGLIGAIPL